MMFTRYPLTPLLSLMQLISINTQGLRLPTRRTTAFNFFKQLKCDAIFLQETHWTTELEHTIRSEWDGHIIFNHGTAHSCGVAILLHSRLSCQISQSKCDNQGRINVTEITLDDHAINLVNIYAPRTNTERQNFYKSLADYLTTDNNNIIGGDFNSISNPKQSAINDLTKLMAQYQLSDIWHSQQKTKLCYTWTGKNPIDNSIIRTRIDKFLISDAITHLIIDSSIKPYPFSDHDYTSLSLNMDNIQRGPSYWHFNNELLQDAVFEAEINDFWAHWLTTYRSFKDPLSWWDKAKHHFKNIAIRHATINNKIKRHKKLQLERLLIHLQDKSKSGLPTNVQNYLSERET